MLADERKPVSQKHWCLHFKEFIRLFEESGFNEEFLKGDGGELRKLYDNLVDSMNRDEQTIPAFVKE